MPKDMTSRASLPKARIADRLAFIAEVVAPTLVKGPLARRPRAVALGEALDVDGRAVRRMRRLRARYGDGPLLVPVPGRTHVVVLAPGDVARVLDGTPDPFTPASDEKRRALAHFEPRVSLVSKGAARVDRRRFNEAVLENDRPVHRMAQPFLRAVDAEAERLLADAGDRLDWERFTRGWHALVRRIVLGAGARDDEALTDQLERLRHRANWVMLRPRRPQAIEDLRRRIETHLARADTGSLAERIAALPKGEATEPADQVAHYLFAFDPGGMATFRALALLAAHPAALARARDEIAAADAGEGRAMLPFLRATLLESLRLWPTTPVILRQAVRDVDLPGGRIPKGANVIVFAPFFHRDDELDFAHRFAPELWIGENAGPGRPVRTMADGAIALVPFSAGPGRCPASDLVPMVASAMFAALVAARTPRLADPARLGADRPLPATLDNYTLSFELGA